MNVPFWPQGHDHQVIKSVIPVCTRHAWYAQGCYFNIAQLIRPWMSRILGSDKIVPVRRGRHVDK